MGPDGVLTDALIAAAALVFAVGAWQKLRDPLSFEISLEAYALAPAALLRPLSFALPALELASAALLLPTSTRALGALLALLLLAIVTGAVAINLLRGHTDVGCGCGGLEDEQPLSWALVVRNVLLAAAVASGLATGSGRALVWLDYLTVAAGALCLYGLYVAANQLIANQPRLLRLREAP